jgi:hypothetical protein
VEQGSGESTQRDTRGSSSPEYCWRVSIAELDVLQKLVFYLISALVQMYYFSLVPLCRIWSSMPTTLPNSHY